MPGQVVIEFFSLLSLFVVSVFSMLDNSADTEVRLVCTLEEVSDSSACVHVNGNILDARLLFAAEERLVFCTASVGVIHFKVKKLQLLCLLYLLLET